MKLYLAGPDVFAPDADARFMAMRDACHRHGFTPLTPVDNELPKHLSGLALARHIKAANVTLLLQCDAVVAHIASFRGPNMDPGTAWEIGYAEALGKPVHLWMQDRRLLAERTPGQDGRDADGWMIEDFGLAENLMIAVSDHPVAHSFEDALKQIRK